MSENQIQSAASMDKYSQLVDILPGVGLSEIAVLVKSGFLPPNVPPATVGLWLNLHKARGLDPFQKHIHITPYNAFIPDPNGKQEKNGKRGNWTVKYEFISSIDSFRFLADRGGRYAGNDAYVFNGGARWDQDHQRWDIRGMTEAEHRQLEGNQYPLTAIAMVWRYGRGDGRELFAAEAGWDSYYKGEGNDGRMWRKMPYLMLGKCAEAQALRKAFPAELGGLYIPEEMHQRDEEAIPSGQTNTLKWDEEAIRQDIAQIASPIDLKKYYDSLSFEAQQAEDVSLAFEARMDELKHTEYQEVE